MEKCSKMNKGGCLENDDRCRWCQGWGRCILNSSECKPGSKADAIKRPERANVVNGTRKTRPVKSHIDDQWVSRAPLRKTNHSTQNKPETVRKNSEDLFDNIRINNEKSTISIVKAYLHRFVGSYAATGNQQIDFENAVKSFIMAEAFGASCKKGNSKQLVRYIMQCGNNILQNVKCEHVRVSILKTILIFVLTQKPIVDRVVTWLKKRYSFILADFVDLNGEITRFIAHDFMRQRSCSGRTPNVVHFYQKNNLGLGFGADIPSKFVFTCDDAFLLVSNDIMKAIID